MMYDGELSPTIKSSITLRFCTVYVELLMCACLGTLDQRTVNSHMTTHVTRNLTSETKEMNFYL